MQVFHASCNWQQEVANYMMLTFIFLEKPMDWVTSGFITEETALTILIVFLLVIFALVFFVLFPNKK